MKKEKKIVIYESKDGKVEFRADAEKDTIWATQEQISKLFNCERSVITKHLKNIFEDEELQEKSICANFAHMGKTGQEYKVKHYNLDAIIAVGYRVNSKKATQFRIWATGILRDYLIKGFNLNQRTLTLSKEKLDNLHEAIEFIESASADKPIKAKLSLRLTKDVIK